MNYTKGWFSHLVNTIPIEARKNQTSMYTIALEGWRRGMDLKFYNRSENNRLQIRYSLTYNNKTHFFNGSCGDKVTEEAIEICEDKGRTNDYLSKNGVPIPYGKMFDNNSSNDEIVRFGKEIKFPLVLKPTNGCAGKGVVANIKSEDELRDAIIYVREELEFEEIIVEKFIEGDEIRVYVLNGRVLGATNRRPANIIGDGVSTIRTLIHNKNEFRKEVPHLYFRPIKIDNEVKKSIEAAGYTINSVLKNGERLYLRKISNVSKGGDPIAVTHKFSDEQKQIAVKATEAIPGLVQCGVDMIVNYEENTAMVLELNTRAGIGSHLFPLEGDAIDIPKEIIDYYFPESITETREIPNVYFDFGSLINAFKGRAVSNIDIYPYPGRLISKRFILKGDYQLIKLYEWLKKHVYSYNLHGSLSRIDDQRVELIISGKSLKAIDEFSYILQKNEIKKNTLDIIEEPHNKPVKLGFSLQDGLKSMNLRQLESNLKSLNKEYQSLDREKNKVSSRIEKIYDSRTWKITKPIRLLMKKIR